MIIGRYTKQPVERLDYDIDFSEFLGTDTLVEENNTPPTLDFPRAEITSTTEAIPTLTVVGIARTNSNRYIKVTLSGGTDGVSYKVTVTALSAGGRIKQTEFTVKVKDQ